MLTKVDLHLVNARRLGCATRIRHRHNTVPFWKHGNALVSAPTPLLRANDTSQPSASHLWPVTWKQTRRYRRVASHHDRSLQPMQIWPVLDGPCSSWCCLNNKQHTNELFPACFTRNKRKRDTTTCSMLSPARSETCGRVAVMSRPLSLFFPDHAYTGLASSFYLHSLHSHPPSRTPYQTIITLLCDR